MDFHDARTCVIFGAGDYYDETPAIPDDAFVVAADGGLDHARAFGIDADFVVGDFDSITGDRPTQNDRTIALPSEKDDPDLLSALKIGWLRGEGVTQIVLDPGFGFSKTVEQNFRLLGEMHRLGELGYPVLAGISRKSMIYKTLDTTPDDALAGTTALHWECLRQGASILRVHDTREAAQIVALYERYEQSNDR